LAGGGNVIEQVLRGPAVRGQLGELEEVGGEELDRGVLIDVETFQRAQEITAAKGAGTQDP
jgi:hypothetical protein